VTAATGASLSLACQTLERPRSWFYYRRQKLQVRPVRRTDLEEAIRQIVQGRPASYGYRRVHGMLSLPCDPKTVYRLMKRNAWLSNVRQKTVHPGRLHEGQVAVRGSNRRWSSDLTWIKAWDGTRGRLAVILDCADRMVLAWRFAPRIRHEDLCEMIREALFRRFGDFLEGGRGIELLSDNGPEYLAEGFRTFLDRMGLQPCRTPIRSPESNGVVEAFFGGFKRDYVYQNRLDTFETIQQQLPGWIRDYNEVAPHGSLGMKSPAVFYAEWKVKNKNLPVQN
jgi:putative transposase